MSKVVWRGKTKKVAYVHFDILLTQVQGYKAWNWFRLLSVTWKSMLATSAIRAGDARTVGKDPQEAGFPYKSYIDSP